MCMSFRVGVIENLSNALSSRKTGGDIKAWIDVPLVFAQQIVIPSLLLTASFKHADTKEAGVGNQAQLLY